MTTQPDMNSKPGGDDIIIDSNPDCKEMDVYCGGCGTKMANSGCNKYKCSKCGLEIKG